MQSSELREKFLAAQVAGETDILHVNSGSRAMVSQKPIHTKISRTSTFLHTGSGEHNSKLQGFIDS